MTWRAASTSFKMNSTCCGLRPAGHSTSLLVTDEEPAPVRARAARHKQNDCLVSGANAASNTECHLKCNLVLARRGFGLVSDDLSRRIRIWAPGGRTQLALAPPHRDHAGLSRRDHFDLGQRTGRAVRL